MYDDDTVFGIGMIFGMIAMAIIIIVVLAATEIIHESNTICSAINYETAVNIDGEWYCVAQTGMISIDSIAERIKESGDQ